MTMMGVDMRRPAWIELRGTKRLGNANGNDVGLDDIRIDVVLSADQDVGFNFFIWLVEFDLSSNLCLQFLDGSFGGGDALELFEKARFFDLLRAQELSILCGLDEGY